MKCNYDFLGTWNGCFSHLPRLNYGCKIECLQNALHWQSLNSECQCKTKTLILATMILSRLIFKDFLALKPRTLGHKTSVLLSYKKWEIWTSDLLDN